MREVNYIFYMALLYMFSNLYIVLKKGPIYKLFDIEKLIKYDFLIIIVVVLGIIFLLVNYYRNINQGLKTIIFKIILPIVIILLGLNYPNFGLDGIIYAVVVYLIVTYIFMYPVIFCKNRIDGDNNNLKLYPSRKTQEDILTYALENYNLIVLDGKWGSGKTTFMNIAMRDNMEKYYYIPINVMLFENRNSLKTEFLNQLKGIFKKEGIFQGSLMDFDYYLDGVSNDWVKVVKNIIFSKSKSFKEANEKLKSEIGKIEKRIVVGIDNLERIYGESEHEWKQILGFIHELQELGIKIVVMANLEEMLTTNKKTEEKIKLVLNSKDDSEIKFFGDVEIQKIEQEKNDNYNYFDKFYEFKLQLNEVTTEEIIDKVEISKNKEKNIKERERLKNQIKGLIVDLEKGFKKLESDHLSGNKNEEEKKKSQEEMSKYTELQNRYLNNILNPRKIEKLMWDIKTKQKKITNIYNFIDDGDEYEKLIFKASIFLSFYFDYLNVIKEKKFTDFYRENRFFEYFFTNIGESYRGLNRLLYCDYKEDIIIKEIKKLISTKEINLSTLDKSLKVLEIYSSSLDPDYNQETTKEAYRVIEDKLTKLEKIDEKKIHEIIEENEENICRLNYLTYPNELGIFKDIKYKFKIESKHEEKGLLNQYSNLLKLLDDAINSSFSTRNRREFFRELVGFRNTILVFFELTKNPNLSYKEILELYEKYPKKFTINDIEKLKDKIENRVKSNYITKELEGKIFERLLNLLEILKKNLSRSNIIIKSNKILEDLEQYNGGKDGNDKIKFLDKILWQIPEEKEILSSEEIQKINCSLDKIMESESDFELLFKLNEFKNECKIYIFPKQIKELSEEILDINKNGDKEKYEIKKEELIKFVNEKLKEIRWQYIFNGSWDKDLEKFKEIGVEIDKDNYLIKKKC